MKTGYGAGPIQGDGTEVDVKTVSGTETILSYVKLTYESTLGLSYRILYKNLLN